MPVTPKRFSNLSRHVSRMASHIFLSIFREHADTHHCYLHSPHFRSEAVADKKLRDYLPQHTMMLSSLSSTILLFCMISFLGCHAQQHDPVNAPRALQKVDDTSLSFEIDGETIFFADLVPKDDIFTPDAKIVVDDDHETDPSVYVYHSSKSPHVRVVMNDEKQLVTASSYRRSDNDSRSSNIVELIHVENGFFTEMMIDEEEEEMFDLDVNLDLPTNDEVS